MNMEMRGQNINLPESGPRADIQLVRFLSRLLKLDRLQRIELSARGIFITRAVNEDEDVLPMGIAELLTEVPVWPGVSFLLQRIELFGCSVQVPENPLIGWNAAVVDLEARQLIPCAVLAPLGDYFDAYFGLPENANVDRFLGLQVVRDEAIEVGKLVFLGSPLGVAVEATHGVVMDTGVTV